MLPSKLFKEIHVNRKGIIVQIRSQDGGVQESNTVESNLLYEILQELKKSK